jgi:hypothetical protein
MHKAQKIALICGIVAFSLLALFPVWNRKWTNSYHSKNRYDSDPANAFKQDVSTTEHRDRTRSFLLVGPSKPMAPALPDPETYYSGYTSLGNHYKIYIDVVVDDFSSWVDLRHLFIELFVVSLPTAGLIFAFKKQR